jgi:archaellum biogenesis protein FlaJ (TadC family)
MVKLALQKFRTDSLFYFGLLFWLSAVLMLSISKVVSIPIGVENFSICTKQSFFN